MSEGQKMKILLIGTSHSGAMKFAWDEIGPQHPDIEVEYVAAHRDKLNLLTLDEDMVLRPDPDAKTDGGTADDRRLSQIEMNLKDFDVVVHVGWGNDPVFLRSALMSLDVDGLREQGAETVLSRPAFDAIIKDYCEQSLPPKEWRKLTGTQIISVETPRRNEAVLDGKTPGTRGAESDQGYFETFEQASEQMVELMPKHGVTFVRQPAETVAENGFTIRDFGTGSAKFRSGEAHKAEDRAHMNADYGKLVWAAILDKAQTPPAAQ